MVTCRIHDTVANFTYRLNMKRSLGAPTVRPVSSASRGLKPLVEGPVVQPRPALEISHAAPLATDTKRYQRGAMSAALGEIRADPVSCSAHIQKRLRSDTALAPHISKLKTWSRLSTAAGFQDPTRITPDMIFTVLGALDKAGYRSSETYLDAAKQITSSSWT